MSVLERFHPCLTWFPSTDCGYRHYRHSGYEEAAVSTNAFPVERNFYGYALNDFREVAGGIVRRKQGELRTGSRRHAIDVPSKRVIREGIDGNFDFLFWLHPGELCLFVVGDNPQVVFHDR